MRQTAITDQQRIDLRRWFYSQSPKPSQQAACEWFLERFHRHVHRTTICYSLSSRYKHLDITRTDGVDNSKVAKAQWPILEEILFKWIKLIEQQAGLPTGDIITVKAREIWPKIPQYSAQPIPNFSQGWLEKFKRRYNIKNYQRHGEASSVPGEASSVPGEASSVPGEASSVPGEASSVPGEASSVPGEAHDQMKAIQTLCGDYKEKDIYNMDETGLFWKLSPSTGLNTAARPGIKQDKQLITIIACCNYDGSDKMPIWAIGKTKNPRSLKHINLASMQCIWRGNKKAWMTSIIMVEWLQDFYNRIGNSRNVLLLMDNFKVHITGVEMAPPPSNIRIQWLPPNATSMYQPLDQGIINNLKHHYKKHWLNFMITCYERNDNPYGRITLYNALDWVTRSWLGSVKASTIYNCFRKARILPSQESINLPENSTLEIDGLYRRAQLLGNIADAMKLSNFLNPQNETPGYAHESSLPEIDDIIANHPLIDPALNVNNDENEEAITTNIKIPNLKEALGLIDDLILHKQHNKLSTPSEISFLYQLRASTEAQIRDNMQQSTLDRWFSQ